MTLNKCLARKTLIVIVHVVLNVSQDLSSAMKMLGLNPMEQEVIDMTNEITRNGFIYFPEFCGIVTKQLREEDEEVFRQNMFKVNPRISSKL